MLADVGILGLGNMGVAFARRLADQGFQVHLWNRNPALRREKLGWEERAFCETPREAGERSDLILVCVSDEWAVQQVLSEEHGLLKDDVGGRSVLLMSTVGVTPCKIFREAVEDAGARFVACPVSGGSGPMYEGTALLLIGHPVGKEPTVNEWQVLNALSSYHLLLEPPETAMALKLCLNVLLAQMTTGLCEAAELADSLGVSVPMLFEALRRSRMACPYLESKRPMLTQEKATLPPSFALKHLLKDVLLARDAAPHMPVTQTVARFLEYAQARGFGEDDAVALRRVLTGGPRPRRT